MTMFNDGTEGGGWALLLDRRTVLRGGLLGGAGLAAAALIGCGDDDDDDDDDDDAAAVVTDDSSGDSSSDDATTDDSSDEAPATGEGMLVRDESLPYPYQFPEPAAEPKAGGTMTVGVTFDVVNFDPTVSAAGGTITVPNYVYNRLIGMKGGPSKDPFQIELEPELAASWERTPDGQVFTFNLRDDVAWQNLPPLDGRPFTAEDVKFSYERYAANGVHQSYWRNISSTEAVDDLTFKATMGDVTADFILPLASRYQTIHPRELVDDASIERQPVGTGPMILEVAEQGSRITFTKNPDYFERDVLLDGVELRIMPDQSARLAAFRVGQIEYGYSVVSALDDLEQLVSTNPDIQVNLTPVVNGTIPFGMNLSNPKYQDERLRQALTLAIDTELMEEVIYSGLAKTLPLHPWGFVLDEEPKRGDASLGPWFGRFDPAEARKLLEAAGVDDLTIDAIYFAYGNYIIDQSEILISNFSDIGVTLNARSVDYTEFNSTWVPAEIEDATTSGWLTVGFDADNFFFNAVHSESPGNRWRLNDPQVDTWAEQQSFELDPDARREIHRQMWDYFLEKMYYPPLPSRVGLEVYQPWLRGIRFGGIFGTNSSYYDWGDQVASAWLDK